MENPFQAPSATIEPDMTPARSYDLASRWARLGAGIIDGLIAVGFALAFMIGVLGKNVFVQPPPAFTIAEQVATPLVGVLFYLLLHGALLHRRGQTVGKWLLRIRIVDLLGNRIPLGRIIGLRLVPVWLASNVPYLGGAAALINLLFIFRRDRRCVHDLIAGTVVVRVPRRRGRAEQPSAQPPRRAVASGDQLAP